MDLDQYQDAARRTLNVDWPEREQMANAVMGLAGEAGEVADLYKKMLYHGHAVDAMTIVDECGDVLWYLAAIASLEGLSLSDILFEALSRRGSYPLKNIHVQTGCLSVIWMQGKVMSLLFAAHLISLKDQ